jgi:type IV pilus assembly protein PilC
MAGSYLQTILFSLNRPEPLRQASLLMVLSAGIGDGETLTESLAAHASDCGSPWSDRIRGLGVLLEHGQTLSSALSTSPGLLPDTTMIAIRVAEQNGTLRDVLIDEATRLMQDHSAELGGTRNLPGTLLWLTMISTVSAGLVTFIMIFIIPKFKKIFEDFDTDLPAATQSLIGLADVAFYAWPLVLLPTATLSLGTLAFAIYAGVKRLGRGVLPFAQHWPRYWMPDVLRMLSFTVTAEKPIGDALAAITREMQPGRAATKISRLRTQVEAGQDCIDCMASLRLLAPREAAFLNSAQKTRHLDWALQHLAIAMDRRRLRWVNMLTRLLQPVAVIMIGSLVGFIVVAMFLPLVKLLNDLS